MKRILIIANLYHASPRIPGLATYLQEFGWEATIITPSIDNAERRLGFPEKFLKRTKIAEAPYQGDIFWFWRRIFKLLGFKTDASITEQIKERVGVAKERSFIDVLMNWYQTIFAYPDTEKTWRKSAFKAASEMLKKEHFKAILSSSPFPTSHIVAAKLKRRFALPWLADFRDPWTQNHNYPYGGVRKQFEEKLEIKTLKNAEMIIAATLAYARKQEHLHHKPAVVITNGFEPGKLNASIPLTRKFTLTYTGTIYSGKQDPEKFFVALTSLISENLINPDDLEIRFFGAKSNWLKNKIMENNLTDFVRQYGIISRTESLRKQQESQLLLFFNWEDSEERGVYPGKFFEYLSSQRPILASGGFPEDDLEKLLSETKAGIYATTIGEIKTALLNSYKEYKSTGRVSYHGDVEAISKYSYCEIAGEFVEVLNKIVEK